MWNISDMEEVVRKRTYLHDLVNLLSFTLREREGT